jgi:subtilisin family serine protease
MDPRLRRLVEHVDAGQKEELVRAKDRGLVAEGAAAVLYKRVLVKLFSDAIPTALAHLEWNKIVDEIYSVNVPVAQLETLATTAGVQFVSGGHVVGYDLDTSRAETRADRVQAGVPPFSGQGVVVGIIDFGCDFVLDDFRQTPGGPTRIEFLWDQSLAPAAGEHSPAGFPHGVEYTAADIDAALTGTPGRVRHRALPASHGTHVMGIAAGNGSSFDAAFPAGGFVGMAPEAAIVFVQPSANDQDTTFTDSVHVAEAMAYIFEKARILGRPCVINMSLGQNGGSHDGESIVERAVDRLLEQPGRAFVVAGGNEHVWRTHASGLLAQGQVRTLHWRVGGPVPLPGIATVARPDRTVNELEIWYSSRDAFDVRVVDPAGDGTPVLAPGGAPIDHTFPGGHKVFIDSERFTVMNGDARIYIEISPERFGATLASGTWLVEITARESVDGAFDAWIERDFRDQANSYADQSFFEDPDFHPEKTLGTPATTRRTIAVANYRHAPPVVVSSSSGRGRTRDGRPKPEVAAPGTDIRSSSAQGGRPRPVPPGGAFPMRVSMSGTSMASPHVAGIVALMLQKEPQLTAAQIAKILVASARPGPAMGTAFDVGFGFGLVDAERAVEMV